MSAVNVTGIRVLENPAAFSDPLRFEIQYDCHQDLQDDLEWKILYIGSTESERYDQVLEDVCVGPVTSGTFKFQLEADAPDPNVIPQEELLGVTAILLMGLYKDKEFVRVGFIVNIEYNEEELQENPPETPQFHKLVRNILVNNPRITRFAVEFDREEPNSQKQTTRPRAPL
eukprot:TRINITY_DN8511_c0_g1_i10.p2 TRINITY_DN8511_c0_g1~~TRINITY_DN8511_c0_g1_i10.p2  ORF type:complete len:189 (-),score=20.35 TRINITY_DN8511_c0_g1_i10:32-547(-)